MASSKGDVCLGVCALLLCRAATAEAAAMTNGNRSFMMGL